jgi:SAM-dependent methyltransferase
MLYHDRERAGSFGAEAERYDRARPSYPAALIDALLMDSPHEVLDVGCGTGIAARLLSDRGCRVLGVEPDPRMAAVAQRHGVTVETDTFEDWDPAGRRFDLVTSAQAWHWVDPAAGAAKAATVLRPGGRIGVFWNRGVPPADVQRRFEAVYARHAPDVDKYSTLLGNGGHDRFAATADSLGAAGAFDGIERLGFGHEQEYTTGGWLDQLPTHSDHQQLEPERRDALLLALGEEVDRMGGSFVMRYDTVLVTACKRAAPEDDPPRRA